MKIYRIILSTFEVKMETIKLIVITLSRIEGRLLEIFRDLVAT